MACWLFCAVATADEAAGTPAEGSPAEAIRDPVHWIGVNAAGSTLKTVATRLDLGFGQCRGPALTVFNVELGAMIERGFMADVNLHLGRMDRHGRGRWFAAFQGGAGLTVLTVNLALAGNPLFPHVTIGGSFGVIVSSPGGKVGCRFALEPLVRAYLRRAWLHVGEMGTGVELGFSVALAFPG